MPKAKVPNNAKCSNCDKPFHRSPSYLKEYTHCFCSNTCRYQFFTGRSNPHNPKTLKRIELSCKNCGKTFYRSTHLANIGKHKFCGLECYYSWKTTYSGSYHKRDLESSTKQRLVRFLCAHGVGAYGKMGEDIIISVKSGFYVPGLSVHDNPLHMLAWKLRAIGHTRLASMVEDGSWEDQDKWPATRNEKIKRAIKSTLPWELDDYSWP